MKGLLLVVTPPDILCCILCPGSSPGVQEVVYRGSVKTSPDIWKYGVSRPLWHPAMWMKTDLAVEHILEGCVCPASGAVAIERYSTN